MYRSWNRSQAFVIQSAWMGLALGALPIPLAVWAARYGLLSPFGPLGSALFAALLLAGLCALPLATAWAVLAGAALLFGAARAKRYATGDEVPFFESGIFTLLSGLLLLVAAVLVPLAVAVLGAF